MSNNIGDVLKKYAPFLSADKIKGFVDLPDDERVRILEQLQKAKAQIHSDLIKAETQLESAKNSFTEEFDKFLKLTGYRLENGAEPLELVLACEQSIRESLSAMSEELSAVLESSVGPAA